MASSIPSVAAKLAATGTRRRIHRVCPHPPKVGFEDGPYEAHLARYDPGRSLIRVRNACMAVRYRRIFGIR